MSVDTTPEGMLYLRLGMTETTLLFYYWLQHIRCISNQIFNERKDSQYTLVNWLYTTSGFYDKTITGTYFNFNAEKCITSARYNTYMTRLLTIVKNTHLVLSWHNIPALMQSYKNEFEDYIRTVSKSYSIYNMPIQKIFTTIANKRILIVNPMSSLMKQQYESGNVRHIYTGFPDLTDIQIYENPYTFFNTGPDTSILETADKICTELSHRQFDVAIVSCGAYSALIGNYIRRKMGKDVIVLGGDLLSIFGIKTGRNKNSIFNEYWRSVPDHLKPKDYMKIENGCYW
jgi:hypothetical protein